MMLSCQVEMARVMSGLAVKDIPSALLEELVISQRIVRAGTEVVPRFTVYAPDGKQVAFVQLPQDAAGRVSRFNAMRNFMIWKAANAFLLATELYQPEALFVVAVTRDGVTGVVQPIARGPVGFGEVSWLARGDVDAMIVDLLPPRQLEVSHEELAFMRAAFEQGSIEGITWRDVV